MLPKTNRLTRQECDSLLQGKNNVLHSPSFFVRYEKASDFKVAVSVSKKVSKKAVERNRLRRLVYDSFQNHPDIPVHILISVKKGTEKSSKSDIQNEVDKIVRDIKNQIS